MKEKWTEPQTLIEEFVPNEYIAACKDDGHYELLPNAIPDDSQTKYYLDKNWNQILDYDEMGNGVQVTTSASAYDKITDNSISYWGWKVDKNGTISDMLRLFDTGNGQIYVAYQRQWVSNKNMS